MRKGLLTALTFCVLNLALALSAFAQNIYLSHTLNGVTEGVDTATLDITLHVENTGVTDYNNLTLDYVPLMIMAVDPVLVKLISIGAGQAVDVPIIMNTPLPFDLGIFGQDPLFWAGEYDSADESGTIAEFPTISLHTGGVL